MIVCIGYLNVEDTVYPGRPEVKRAPGGAALYFVTAAKLWDTEVAIVSRIGENYPEPYLTALRAGGIDTEHVKTLQGPTMAGRTAYDAQGGREYTMYTPLERRMELTPQPGDWQPEGVVAAVHLATIPPHSQLAWIRALRDRAALISLDTDVSFVHKDRAGLVQALENVDIFFPNEDEARALFPGLDLEKVAQRIADLGPWLVIIKRGRKGALLYTREAKRFYQIPALPVEVVDVTGAGDAFAGGFMAGIVTTDNLKEAGWRGSIAASLTIQDYGGLHVLQHQQEAVQKKLQHFKEKNAL